MSAFERLVADLVTKEAIRAIVVKYARAVDRRDWEGMRAAYHPDAYDDHGDYKGDIEGLIDWVRQRHANVEQSMHFLANQNIDLLSEDRAFAETYCVVRQRYGPKAIETARQWLGDDRNLSAEESISADLFCRYLDHFERRQGDWRISRRVLVMEEVRAIPVQPDLLKPKWALARRDETDPLWVEMRAIGLPTPQSQG